MSDNLLTGMQVNRDRARAHRRNADNADKRRSESIERSDTDGFLSQWASGLTAQLERRKAELAEAGDVTEFTGLYEGDRRVKAKIIHYRCRYSHSDASSWLLHEDEAELIERRGKEFIPDGKRSRVQKQLGLTERRETAPAYAFMNGNGTGLSGNVWVAVARKNPDDWGLDAEVVK